MSDTAANTEYPKGLYGKDLDDLVIVKNDAEEQDARKKGYADLAERTTYKKEDSSLTWKPMGAPVPTPIAPPPFVPVAKPL